MLRGREEARGFGNGGGRQKRCANIATGPPSAGGGMARAGSGGYSRVGNHGKKGEGRRATLGGRVREGGVQLRNAVWTINKKVRGMKQCRWLENAVAEGKGEKQKSGQGCSLRRGEPPRGQGKTKSVARRGQEEKVRGGEPQSTKNQQRRE